MKRRNIVKSQSFKNNIFIIISVLLGMVSLCIIRIGVATHNKSIVVSNAKEQMNQGEVGLVDYSGYLDEKMQAIPLIEWWYSEENEKYYFFLPHSFKNNPNVVWVVGDEVNILLDGKEVSTGEPLIFRGGVRYNIC